jgi:predicted nucleic acid-binding protein
MISCYIDTSAYLRWLMKAPNYYKDFGNWDNLISSKLFKLEFYRSIDRIWKLGNIETEQKNEFIAHFKKFENYIHWIELDSNILDKASHTFSFSLGSLDAIHFTSANLYREEFEVGEYFILTHDKELAMISNSFGIDVKGI